MSPVAKNRLPSTVYLLALCQALMMSSNALMVTAAALVGFSLADDKSLSTLPLALQFLATMLTSVPAALLLARIGRIPGRAWYPVKSYHLALDTA